MTKKILNILDLKPKIEKFCEEFLILEQMNIVDAKWGIQHTSEKIGDVVYYPPRCGFCTGKKSLRCKEHKRPLTLEHLYDHFSQEAFHAGKEKSGTLAFVPNFGGKTKTLIIDFDNSDAVNFLITYLVPTLKQLGIDYFIESPPVETGMERSKAHLVVKTELIDIKLLKIFIDIILDQSGVDLKPLKLELFPTHKNTLIRLFMGRHMRRDCAYDIIYKNKRITDIHEGLDAINSCAKTTVSFIQDYVNKYGSEKLEKSKEKKPKRKSYTKFNYVPLNLPLDRRVEDGLPEDVKLLATNCQAMNKLMNLVYEAKLLNDSGKDVHDGVKFIANTLMENDIRNDSTAGEAWFYNAVNETRDRPEDSHNWFARDYYEDNLNILIPRCETWESYFDMCEGCVWKNYPHIENPRQLRYGKQIEKTKVKDLKPVTVDEIRETTLKEVYDKTIRYVQNRESRKDLVIASPPSAGKTYTADSIAVELASQGYNVLIAVPSGSLGDQHVEQIEMMGGSAFILKSHESWFSTDKGKNKNGLQFNECPDIEDISRLTDLGLGAKTIQKRFCKTCPFLEQCPYPGQYSKAALPVNNIVIIQHAHFSCRETMYGLFRDKQFDLLIVDEEFISNISKEIKITDLEIALFNERRDNYPWLDNLINWFEGQPSLGGLAPSEQDLESLKELLESRDCAWKIPEYITHYNSERTYDKRLGLFVFNPIPDIPVRLFTDATPPIEMLEIVLDNKNIEIFGDSEILDLQVTNEYNQIIQVLDSTTSKTALAKNDYELFYLLLEYVGDDIQKSFPDTSEEILLTLYKDEGIHNFTSRAEEWLKRNYPKLFQQHKIIFGRLALGTNDYQYCAAQYQLAGLHFNTLQLHQAAYKLKCIANYWNRLKGRPQVVNMYPWHINEKSPLESISEPLSISSGS